ncbi:MAG: hypothetical protein OXT09_15190 [Myxococcales bacterium]|nr:hypothetical protein [Myxococcales bacterium]
MKRGLQDSPVLLSLAALALALVQWWPALRKLDATGFGDWQMVHHNWEAGRVALLRHGEWPLWDPYHCGGVTILGNPESQLYSPLFLLALPLGTTLAIKLFLVLHIAAALLGVYLWGRLDYDLPRVPALAAAVTWALSGCFAWDGAGGHATFLPFAFAPWILMCFERARESVAFLVATALLITLALFEGGTYPVPYFAVLLGFEVLRRMVTGPERSSPLVAAAAIGALVALCGAVRLIPIALSLGDTPRTVESTDALLPAELLEILTTREHGWFWKPHPYVWPEYGSYIGWAAVGLGALGLLAALGRGRRHLIAGVLLFALLTAGNLGALYPWPLLHQLPVFDSLRVPSRFAILLTLYVAILAAHGLAWLLARLPEHRAVTTLALVCVLAHTADLVHATQPIASLWRDPPITQQPPAKRFHQVSVSGVDYPKLFASFPQRNVGSGACYVGGMNWQVSPHIWHGDKAQARLARGKGRLLAIERTPHRITIGVELDEPATVVINQNHAPGFSASAGEMFEHRGRLAVAVPAGDRQLEVVYRPYWFLPSAVVSAVGLLLSVALIWRARRRSRGTSAAAA